MEDAISLLKQLGFGEYEAKAYTALLQHNALNGYELAKASGVPRPNIYAVLERLEERGAVLRVDTPGGARYRSVAPDELTQRLQSRFQNTLEAAKDRLGEVSIPVEHEYVWNARGYPVLLEQAGAQADAAQESLLVALWPQEAQALGEPLARAAARGVAITTLCLRACVNVCDRCQGQIHRYSVAPEPDQRWLLMIPDGAELLAGTIGQADDTLVVRTRQRLVVDLANWYIRHTIALAALLDEASRHPEQSLSPATRAVLASVAGDESGGGWLERIRQLLTQPAP